MGSEPKPSRARRGGGRAGAVAAAVLATVLLAEASPKGSKSGVNLARHHPGPAGSNSGHAKSGVAAGRLPGSHQTGPPGGLGAARCPVGACAICGCSTGIPTGAKGGRKVKGGPKGPKRGESITGF